MENTLKSWDIVERQLKKVEEDSFLVPIVHKTSYHHVKKFDVKYGMQTVSTELEIFFSEATSARISFIISVKLPLQRDSSLEKQRRNQRWS